MHPKLLSVVLIAMLAGAAGSCSRPDVIDDRSGAAAGDPAVRRHFGSGPVTLSVELSSDAITTADAVACTVTLEVADGYEAELVAWAFPHEVPGLILTQYKEEEVRNEERTLQIRRYELEPEYPGSFALPPLQVYYHREEEVREDVFETEAIPLTVTETPASAEMLELRPLRGLATVEQIEARRGGSWRWVVGGIGVAVAALALLVYLVRRPRLAPPPRPAHEVAMDELRALAAKDLVAKGQIEPFFVEITRIVRDYIESAFGLRAPEQTTEEFLAAMTSSPMVSRHRGVLEPFLTAADEVKFARARPETETIQRAFDTARDFVLQTSSTNGDTV